MSRTRWLQETKQMRFLEAYEGYQCKRLTQDEAALLLGGCARSFRRYMCRYEEEGLDGLLDKRLDQPSHHRAPVDEVMALVDLSREDIQVGMCSIFTHFTNAIMMVNAVIAG